MSAQRGAGSMQSAPLRATPGIAQKRAAGLLLTSVGWARLQGGMVKGGQGTRGAQSLWRRRAEEGLCWRRRRQPTYAHNRVPASPSAQQRIGGRMKACAWMRWVERGAGRVQCRGGRAEWLSRGGRACACARRECVRARRACMRQASCTHRTPHSHGVVPYERLECGGGVVRRTALRNLNNCPRVRAAPCSSTVCYHEDALTLRRCAGAGRRAHPGAAPHSGGLRPEIGNSSSPESPTRKSRVCLTTFFPACIFWAGGRRLGWAQAGATFARA